MEKNVKCGAIRFVLSSAKCTKTRLRTGALTPTPLGEITMLPKTSQSTLSPRRLGRLGS